MIAFVLSGAGNRGPLEVGALQALFKRGIRPDLIVGTSAGALNAMYIAAYGTELPIADRVAALWEQVTKDVVYPENIFRVAWRVWRKKNSLYSSDGMREWLQDALPPNVKTFGDLQVPLYVAAVDLLSSRVFVFGEDGSAPLIDPVLASASVPAIHPPVEYAGLQLVDGGVLANVAASFAMEKGATEIYVINAGSDGQQVEPAEGVLEVLGYTMSVVIAQGLLKDIERAIESSEVDLHHIHLSAFKDISFRDFSKTKEMIKAGREQAESYLAAPRPRSVAPADLSTTSQSVGGGREYTPSYRR